MLAFLKDFMVDSSPSPANTIPASPASPTPTNLDLHFTPIASPSISIVIPFLDISSSATSILPPTPPTFLVSPLPQLGLPLFTPSTFLFHPTIPFNPSSPSSSSLPIIDLPDTSSLPTLTTNLSFASSQAHLSCPPFIGILPGTTSEVFLTPQPLNFIPPPPPSISIYTPVILSPLSQAPSIPPLTTLPPLPSILPLAPYLSSLPNLTSLTFTLRQASSSLSTADPALSTTDPSVLASSSTNPPSSSSPF